MQGRATHVAVALPAQSSCAETDDVDLTRRRLLELAARTAGAAVVAPLIEPLAALSSAPRWPVGRLPASAARRVDRSQFMPQSQLRVWQQQLDRMGLRATASPVHERYVDQLRDRLERVGVRQLRFEPVPLDRWTTDTWSRWVLSGSSAGAVQTASYIPYSGRTSFAGVTGELTLIDPGPAAGTTPSAGAEVHLRPECQRAGPGRAGRTLVLPGRADPLWRARSLRYSISPHSQPRGDIAHGTVPLRNAVQRARNLRRPRFLAVAGSCRLRSGNAG